MNPPEPDKAPRDLRSWGLVAIGALPIVVALVYFSVKPPPERFERVRPPGPTIPLDAGHLVQPPPDRTEPPLPDAGAPTPPP